MKIPVLTLRRFRSFENVTLNLDAPRVMIAGLNEAGKTTVREAIRYLLTGKAQGLDAKGSGAEILVPTFANDQEVQVESDIPGIGPLERTWKPTGSGLVVKRFTGNNGTQQLALYDALKTSEAFLQAVIDSETFLHLHHADAKAVILALLDVRVEYLGTATTDGFSMTLPELDSAYKKAYDDRRAAKAVRVTVPPAPVGEFPPLDAIEARLTELHAEAQRLAAAGGSTSERRRQLQEEYDRLAQPFPLPPVPVDLPVQIADAEERLAIMEQDVAPDDIADTMQTLPSNTDLAEGVSVPMLRSRAEALAQHKPANGCVLDPDVRCDTPKVNFSKRAKAILAELDGLPAAPVPVPAAIKPPSPLTEVRHRLEGMKVQQKAYEDAAAKERGRLIRREAIEKELSTVADTSTNDAVMADVRARITKGQTIREQALHHAQALQAVKDAQERAKGAAAEVDRLEALCETLGPNGARVDALAKALGPFEQAVNSLTGQFGWKVRFLLDPWTVLVNERPVETYSRSERYRIGIAIQLAIAGFSGLSFAVVDELDMLNKENRELLGRLLYQSKLEQIIILGTREPEMPLPTVANMVCYRLGKVDGKSGILERVPA